MSLNIMEDDYGILDVFAKRTESFYQAFFNSNVFAVASLDKKFRITEMNHSFSTLLGTTQIAQYNRNPKEWIEIHSKEDSHELIFKLKSGKVFQQEFSLKNQQGYNTFLRITFIPVVVETEFEGVILIVSDISKMKRDELIHKQLALFDEMTGLPNRRHFFSNLSHTLREKNEDLKSLHVALISLDNLKELNDFGFHIGDSAIKFISQLMSKTFNDNIFISRVSGNEFAIQFENASIENLDGQMKKLLFSLNHIPHQLYGQEITLECSIGMSLWPNHGNTAEKLIHCAEKAMFAAKNLKTKYCVYTHDLSPTYQLNLEEKIKIAIEENQFYLVFQPIVELQTKKIVGYEALVRWQHPAEGIIAPNQFIPFAEQSGIIIEVEKKIIELACKKLTELNAVNPGIFLSINISAHHFHQNIVEHIVEATTYANVNPHQLKIEITETCSMKDPNNTILKLNELKQLGCQVSIDDFGVGYSSLQYLGNFPADEIKLDQSFINPITSQKLTIINAVFAIARDYKINVVAEGIETEDQLQYLIDLGCKYGQGYILGKPQKM